MRLSTLLFGAIVVGTTTGSPPAVANGVAARSAVATQAVDVSAAKRKHPSRHRTQRRTRSQTACTRFGCRPIPRGCHIETEYNPWTWNPSGFDAVVCPGR
jgi:hypothetical protein